MSNFITNDKDKKLSTRINNLIEHSGELNFLVGYFYFSGINEIYKSLLKLEEENKNFLLKILVGLSIDIINNNIIEYFEKQKSDKDLEEKFINSVKKFINYDDYDNEHFIEQINFFIKLIEKNKLIIRKTKEPNHSKLYLFNISEEYNKLLDKSFITGSSNLTKAGFKDQNEFNVEIKDYGFEEAKKYFDDLWNKSIKITEKDILKDQLLKVINEETHIRKITPYEAFVLSLKEYINTYQDNSKDINNTVKILEEKGYKAYNYQIDAIKQGLSIIEKNNGLIIADVVGLGKSIIASSIAKSLKKRGIIICPPGLIGAEDSSSGWKKYIQDFRLYDWEVYSLGDLQKVLNFIQNTDDIEVIIIDEAHRFRNDRTKSYEYLKNICRNKIVTLLTATPFNNNPNDILSLLSLFTSPKNSNLTINGNLKAEFTYYKNIFEKINYIRKYHNNNDAKKLNKVKKYYKSIFKNDEINLERIDLKNLNNKSIEISKEIKNIIEPITIRRNRLDIQKNPLYSEEVKNLSKTNDPIEIFFELDEEQLNFYDEVLNIFGNDNYQETFKGAIYKPFFYEVGLNEIEERDLNEEENFEYIQQSSLYLLIKRLLVKRFESSFGAFKETINNFKNITSKILEFIKRTNKYILNKKLIENIYELEIEEIEEELRKYSEELERNNISSYHKIYKINEMKQGQDFINDIENDLNLFNEILEKINNLRLVDNDPKLNSLIETINKLFKKEPNRKIIIFSEYLDTVKYLKENLLNKINNKVLVIEKSISQRNIQDINENFDASFKNQKNDYDILLGTDRISEGFNLNRAGTVINYDIPWNPVRVIQRIGRINRISKKVFDELYIINFFPTKRGEDIVKSKEIASSKIFMIHNILGEDSKIFSIDETPQPSSLYSKLQKNPDNFEEESFYTKMLSLYMKIKEENPEILNKIENFPKRIKVAKEYNKNELIVIFRKLHLYIYQYDYDKNQIYIKSFEDIFDNIYVDKNAKSVNLSNNFWSKYSEIKKFNKKEKNITNEKDIEQKSLNILNTIIQQKRNDIEILPYIPFIKDLKDDIENYGTLPYTILRKISEIKYGNNNSIIQVIQDLQNTLGNHYLDKEKEKNKNIDKELIISIENISKSELG